MYNTNCCTANEKETFFFVHMNQWQWLQHLSGLFTFIWIIDLQAEDGQIDDVDFYSKENNQMVTVVQTLLSAGKCSKYFFPLIWIR